MTSLRPSVVRAVISVGLAFSPRVASADMPLSSVQAHDLVALVARHGFDNTGEPLTGSALIVGYDTHDLFLVTAKHVLNPDATKDDDLPATVGVLLFPTAKLHEYARTVILPRASAVKDPLGRLGTDGPVGLRVTRDAQINSYIDRLQWTALADPNPFKAPPDGRTPIQVHAVGNRYDNWDELANLEIYSAKDGDLIDGHVAEATEYGGKSGGGLFDASYHLVGMLIRQPDPGCFTAVDIRAVLAIARDKMDIHLDEPKPYLQLDGNTPATLTVDGIAASSAMRPLSPFPFPGSHSVRISSPSHRDWSGALDLGPWQGVRAEYRLGAMPCATWPWRALLCAATAASLAGAVWIGVEAVAASHDFDDNPSSAGLAKLRTLNGATDVLVGVFLAGAVTVAVDYLLNTPRLSVQPVDGGTGGERQDRNGSR